MRQRRLSRWAGKGALALLAGVALPPSPGFAGHPGRHAGYTGGVGIGVGIGIVGTPGGPAFGYSGVGVAVPYGAYRGFWSNGYSLYGPPVPTYGIVPGTFGGSDQRLYPLPPMWFGGPTFLAVPPPIGPPPMPPGIYEGAPPPRPFPIDPSKPDDVAPPPRG
jgi:hypothetical protein